MTADRVVGGVDVLAVLNMLADEAALAAVLARFGEDADKFGIAASNAVKAHSAVSELIGASDELKDVCNRPSAARTRAQAWRRFDAALANARGTKS